MMCVKEYYIIQRVTMLSNDLPEIQKQEHILSHTCIWKKKKRQKHILRFHYASDTAKYLAAIISLDFLNTT